jgi:hypothetical protein
MDVNTQNKCWFNGIVCKHCYTLQMSNTTRQSHALNIFHLLPELWCPWSLLMQCTCWPSSSTANPKRAPWKIRDFRQATISSEPALWEGAVVDQNGLERRRQEAGGSFRGAGRHRRGRGRGEGRRENWNAAHIMLVNSQSCRMGSTPWKYLNTLCYLI